MSNHQEQLKLEWSDPYALRSGQHLQIGLRSGVYRIRAFGRDAKPMVISRAKGGDALGILHIGQSVDLGVRIRTFRQAAEGLKARHQAGMEFYRWGFMEVFPLDQLRFDYVIVANGKEALRLERKLHEEYRRQYLD